MEAAYKEMKKEAQAIAKRIGGLQVEHDRLVRGMEARIIVKSKNEKSQK